MQRPSWRESKDRQNRPKRWDSGHGVSPGSSTPEIWLAFSVLWAKKVSTPWSDGLVAWTRLSSVPLVQKGSVVFKSPEVSAPPLLDYKCSGSDFLFLLTYFVFFRSSPWHFAIVDIFQTIDVLTGFVQRLYFHRFHLSRTYRTFFLGWRLFSLYGWVSLLTNSHCGRNHFNFWVVPLSEGVLDIPVFCGEKKRSWEGKGKIT